MPTIKANVADYLTQIEALTNTNLQILKTINDSFFTKKNHLFAEIDDKTYVIPSFISLENKINMLQENFENLVKAPETGEAYFNFDGNTRAIEVRKYSHVPDSITLQTVSTYKTESNNIFKDFLTPIPYVNFDLPKLPNDIVEVNVKKIIAKSENLKSLFKNKLNDNQSVNESYGNIYKLLLTYKKDTDYVEYDTIYKLPIREQLGTATYVIESVISDVIDKDLNELITLKLRNNLSNTSLTNTLTYKLFNDTIEKPLQIGDELINFDGTGKVVITDVRPATNTITVKVVNGEYLNFLGTDKYDTNNDSDIHDLSKLRFYASIDFDNDKYVKVPLEEDQYVFIAVAALNSRMNVQGSWGTGILIDTYSLKNDDKSFETYYNDNVKNIGDILFEMTSMITSPITDLSQNKFEDLLNKKPVLSSDILTVMQINKHLDNSTTVKNIKDAYNQKKLAEKSLSELQTKINTLNNKLSKVSFDDTIGIRLQYNNELSGFNNERSKLLKTINDSINTISLHANSSELPIENAKYRIRGFYVPDFDENTNNHIIGIKVQYRYKNTTTTFGNAVSLVNNNNTYIYSDWNELHTHNKSKIATYKDGVYFYKYEDSNESKNEPSYNQIDIPISQGETVDIRLKVVYDYGQPYITMTSDWSNIINVKFPEEFTADTNILSIIEENNNDIETNRFNTILETNGVTSHINDMVIDQNITYYHKPDNISSGFYTPERKIIPLKDKLVSMSNDIATLQNDILGVSGSIKLHAFIGEDNIELYSDRYNNMILEAYNNFITDNQYNGNYKIDTDNNVVSTFINISISNTSNNVVKLYSLFPGNRGNIINKTESIYVNKDNYCNGSDTGVYLKYGNKDDEKTLQTQNQFITFRINDVWTGESYYEKDATVDSRYNKSNGISKIGNTDGLVVYPYISTKYGLCVNSDEIRTYLTINPGEEVIVPIYCEYKITADNTTIIKTISFDLRTSLYNDPINYTLNIIGKNTTNTLDDLSHKNNKNLWDRFISGLNKNYKDTIG